VSALKLSFIVEAIDRATAPIRGASTAGPISRVTRSWSNLPAAEEIA